MKKRILSAFLCMCMMLTMVPAALAVDTQTDPTSKVERIQNTTTWYADATKEFQTKDSYWFNVVQTQPTDYAVSAESDFKTVTISSSGTT